MAAYPPPPFQGPQKFCTRLGVNIRAGRLPWLKLHVHIPLHCHGAYYTVDLIRHATALFARVAPGSQYESPGSQYESPGSQYESSGSQYEIIRKSV